MALAYCCLFSVLVLSFWPFATELEFVIIMHMRTRLLNTLLFDFSAYCGSLHHFTFMCKRAMVVRFVGVIYLLTFGSLGQQRRCILCVRVFVQTFSFRRFIFFLRFAYFFFIRTSGRERLKRSNREIKLREKPANMKINNAGSGQQAAPCNLVALHACRLVNVWLLMAYSIPLRPAFSHSLTLLI